MGMGVSPAQHSTASAVDTVGATTTSTSTGQAEWQSVRASIIRPRQPNCHGWVAANVLLLRHDTLCVTLSAVSATAARSPLPLWTTVPSTVTGLARAGMTVAGHLPRREGEGMVVRSGGEGRMCSASRRCRQTTMKLGGGRSSHATAIVAHTPQKPRSRWVVWARSLSLSLSLSPSLSLSLSASLSLCDSFAWSFSRARWMGVRCSGGARC